MPPSEVAEPSVRRSSAAGAGRPGGMERQRSDGWAFWLCSLLLAQLRGHTARARTAPCSRPRSRELLPEATLPKMATLDRGWMARRCTVSTGASALGHHSSTPSMVMAGAALAPSLSSWVTPASAAARGSGPGGSTAVGFSRAAGICRRAGGKSRLDTPERHSGSRQRSSPHTHSHAHPQPAHCCCATALQRCSAPLFAGCQAVRAPRSTRPCRSPPPRPSARRPRPAGQRRRPLVQARERSAAAAPPLPACLPTQRCQGSCCADEGKGKDRYAPAFCRALPPVPCHLRLPAPPSAPGVWLHRAICRRAQPTANHVRAARASHACARMRAPVQERADGRAPHQRIGQGADAHVHVEKEVGRDGLGVPAAQEGWRGVRRVHTGYAAGCDTCQQAARAALTRAP